jgi:hypothetical protein
MVRDFGAGFLSSPTARFDGPQNNEREAVDFSIQAVSEAGEAHEQVFFGRANDMAR